MEQQHHRRRQYPTQQYDFSAPQQPSPYEYAESGPSQVFTPAAMTPDLQGASAQFGQLNLDQSTSPYASHNVPGTPYNHAHHPSGQHTLQGYSGQPAVPSLNQLYNCDLQSTLPPPVEELRLPPPPPVLPPNVATTGSPSANAGPPYIRSTLNCVPTSNSLLKKSKLPFAVVVRPSAALLDETENVPVVTDTQISRCRRCRTYINPFVEFLDQQHRWKCNVCSLTNDVPTAFDWDAVRNVRADRWARSEINYGVVDFIAPSEYMVRAPQPPVYVFVLDVSVNATSNGLLATAARVIQESLDRLPNRDGRTRVAFLAVDGALNFFRIPIARQGEQAGEETDPGETSLLVVSDLEDPFLPVPSGLLVNLRECRPGIDKLLESLPATFEKTVASSSALGSALKASLKLISSVGGKIVCITASLPNVGVAKLEPREDKRVLGTPKETPLLSAANSFYKSFAIECNRSQVAVDMFLLSSQYQDVASLSNLPRFTGGQTFFYPGWTANREADVARFSHELSEYLSQEYSMEAVLRVRSATGIRSAAFFGNLFVRSSDLMSFSAFPRDQAYVVEMAIDENITKGWVLFQAALLHSTCFGERRIRVISYALPTSGELSDIYASADQIAITHYWTHKTVERLISRGVQESHDWLQARLLEVLKAYKCDVLNTNTGGASPLQLPANLRMLPLLVNSLQKHLGLRRSTNSAPISSDLRSAALCLLTTLPSEYLIRFLYPDFYSLHDMPDEAGYTDETTNQFVFPPKQNLSGEHIVSHGLYLIDDGQVQFLWVGRDAVPRLLEDVFGVNHEGSIPTGKTDLPEVDSEINRRIHNIINESRKKTDSVYYPSLYIVKENSGPSMRLWVTTFLVEDRTELLPSYVQFLSQLRSKLSS